MSDRILDSDVLIDHLRGSAELAPGDGRDLFSVITRAELFAGPPDQFTAIRSLLSIMVEVSLDSAIAEHGGEIRRESGVGLPDALIAASALALDVPLLTRNISDFGRVDGLRLIAPGSAGA